MSRRAIKSINWSAIAERIHENEKPMFAALKSKSDQFLRNMQAYPETVPKIDWSFYKQHVPIAGMVDKFQKEYESLTIPYPEDKYTPAVEEMEKKAAARVKEFCEQSNRRIAEHKKQLEEIKNLIPYAQMTMEDFKEAHPNIAFDVEKPTLWPHNPADQPSDEPRKKKSSH